jgi:hypothetical protein
MIFESIKLKDDVLPPIKIEYKVDVESTVHFICLVCHIEQVDKYLESLSIGTCILYTKKYSSDEMKSIGIVVLTIAYLNEDEHGKSPARFIPQETLAQLKKHVADIIEKNKEFTPIHRIDDVVGVKIRGE